MNRQGVFITGTDTDVGKTYVGSRLAMILWQKSIPLAPRKPAESGCKAVNGGLVGADSNAYFKACAKSISLDIINPFRFIAALAPPAAARAEGKMLTLKELEQACEAPKEESFLLVEGAGGFLSPMAEDGLNADLAASLKLPVLIVAADKLGCINHILLTIESVTTRGLEVAAIVLNRIDPDTSTESNLSWLQQNISIPLVVYQQDSYLYGEESLQRLAKILLP